MNAFIAIVAFLVILAVVRIWVAKRWGTGQASARQAAAVIAFAWAAFPFVGLAGGAPWSLPIVVAASIILGATIFLVGERLLSGLGKRSG